jgi:hypothetical protein
MKLFQRLLVAPAALGLLAPVAANADAFSSTTSLSGSAFFTVGSVEAGTGDADEELYSQYAYTLNVNSSFTGEDLLAVGIEAGDAKAPDPLSNMDSTIAGDSSLSVASLFYNFPVGDLSITAGPLVDQDDVVAATVSAYSDDFRLGAMPYSLAGSETGPGVGATYATGNGIVASASFVADDGDDAAKGINTDSGNDVTTLTLGYNGDGFGGGLVIASNDGDVGTVGYDTFGVGAYYTPESFPATISVAYDTKDPETGGGDDEADLFVGIDYEVGPGILSAAWNTTEVDGGSDNLDVSGFEVSYSYAINDGVTISPGIFTIDDGAGEEDTGMVLETAFSF